MIRNLSIRKLRDNFLFNALNSVSQLIYIDKKKAEDAVLQLSKNYMRE